ncbi:MAG: DMT family transporter [Clostridia bacterium]|nr:DMT family transporter [Clostridia bacterium]
MKTKISSMLLILLAAMIWGFAFVAQVDGADYVGPFTFTGVRFLIGIISLLPVVLIFERGRADKEERRQTFIASLIAGTVLFFASITQQIGIHITGSAGVSGFITGLYTVFVPIAAYLLFRQRTGVNVVCGAVLAVIGLFLLCYKVGEGFYFGVGELLLLVCAFFWTAHIITVDRLGKKLRSLHFAWGQFAVCTVWGLMGMFIFETPTIESIMAAKWSLLYCGVLSVGVAFTLQVVAQKTAEPTFAAILFSTESVFSAIGGAVFGIDHISLLGYIGCAAIFSGVVLSQLNICEKKGIKAERIE